MMFLKSYFTQRHAFHLVDVSVMPIVTASTALTTVIGGVMFFHGYAFGYPTLIFGLLTLIMCFFL
jgi:glucose uptake protein GlcU